MSVSLNDRWLAVKAYVSANRKKLIVAAVVVVVIWLLLRVL
jgi:hypothetical protein